MTDFIKGKIGPEESGDTLFEQGKTQERKPLHFSEEAAAVFDAGRKLWKYYSFNQQTKKQTIHFG